MYGRGSRHRGALPGLIAATVSFACCSAALPANWPVQPITTSGDLGWVIDLERAPDGTLYASSYREGGSMVLFKHTQGSWVGLPSLPSSDYSMALDANGQAHVFTTRYIDGHFELHLSRLNSSDTWETSVLRTGGQMRAAALAFDSQNRPHTAFVDNVDRTLKHLYWTGTSWTTETVASDPYFVYATPAAQIALDNFDRPNFLWYANNGSLRHSAWTGTQYVHRTVGTGYGKSMVFDSANNLHTSYVSSNPNETMYHARFDGNAWTSQAIDTFGSRGSLALDLLERPHIAYGAFRNNLRHAAWNGSAWEVEGITSWSGIINGPESEATLIDPANRMHVLFVDDTKNLHYTFMDVPEPATAVSLLAAGIWAFSRRARSGTPIGTRSSNGRSRPL